MENFLFLQIIIPIGENLSKYTTVSVKIPQDLKEKIRELEIKPSKILRKAIEDEVKRREAMRLKRDIEKLMPVLSRVSMDEIVRGIREDRVGR